MIYPKTRLRRLRKSTKLRGLLAENRLNTQDLIYPVFIVSGNGICDEIASMPNQYQYSVDQLHPLALKIKALKIPAILLFGHSTEKDSQGLNACKSDTCVVEAIHFFRKTLPDLMIITDLCLCSYTSHGHCGPLREPPTAWEVDNDATLHVLSQMAVSHAQAGADFVAPSGMMDGMVMAIRQGLDEAKWTQVGIISYSVKYASHFYGPFREAADCSPTMGDRKTYQMNPANQREALREAELDISEGADMLMVKPGLPYLDVLSRLHQEFNLPILAYQVSGEYSMIKAAAKKGWIDERALTLETLLAFKRAGAQAVITYFALDVAQWLQDDEVC